MTNAASRRKRRPPESKTPMPVRATLDTVTTTVGRGKTSRLVVKKYELADAAMKQAHGVFELEAKMRDEGPAPWAKPGAFCVLAVPTSTPARIAVQSLAAFAHAAIEHSSLPEEMITWSSTTKGWNLVFFFSIPAPSVWTEGELHEEALQDLERYLILQHWAADEDEVVSYEKKKLTSWLPGDENGDSSLAELAGVAERPASTIFEKLTGLSIADIEGALPCGEPWWIIHQSKMVFPIEWE